MTLQSMFHTYIFIYFFEELLLLFEVLYDKLLLLQWLRSLIKQVRIFMELSLGLVFLMHTVVEGLEHLTEFFRKLLSFRLICIFSILNNIVRKFSTIFH